MGMPPETGAFFRLQCKQFDSPYFPKLFFSTGIANRNDKSSLVVPQTEKEVRRPEIIIMRAL